MKAVSCTRYGPPEVLKMTDVPKPKPKDDEILVKICATTVTAGDCRMRAFDVPPSFWLPARFALGVLKPRKDIPGMEMAGQVVSIGKNVTRFNVGDQVYASTSSLGLGTYTEYKCLPESGMVAHAPTNLSLAEAATVPVGGLTTLYFMNKAAIEPGSKVLIYGASGSVGTYSIQLAKHYGAEVTAVCSTANLELAASLGADHLIDYTQEDFLKTNTRYDVIFDAVGKASIARCIRALKPEGIFLHAVGTPGTTLRMELNSLGSKVKTYGGGPPANPEDLVKLKDIIEKGVLRPVIDRQYPLEDIVEAHRYVDTGRKKGNVAIIVQN